MKNIKLNKSTIINIGLIILVIIMSIVLVFSKTKNNKTEGGNNTTNKITNKVKIVASASKTQEFETFSNDNVSMKIPKGWKVELNETTNYGIKVYNPDNSMYSFYSFFAIGAMNKSAAAKKFYQDKAYVWKNGFEKFPVLSPISVTNFYKIWTSIVGNMKSTNDSGYGSFNFPFFYNFTEVETYPYTSLIGTSNPKNVTEGIVRATFTDSQEQNIGEGLFSASIIDLDPSNDYFPLTSYNDMGITAPEFDLVNWEEILLDCVNSIKLSDSYVSATNATLKKQGETVLDHNKEISAAFSSYTSAWTNRQATYDTARQKYSDATLGYERVYDTKTNAVYKAYNGFTNDYNGTQYKAVTDDMYTKLVSGYIEK